MSRVVTLFCSAFRARDSLTQSVNAQNRSRLHGAGQMRLHQVGLRPGALHPAPCGAVPVRFAVSCGQGVNFSPAGAVRNEPRDGRVFFSSEQGFSMRVIHKPWAGHNDALLARQIRTSSGYTDRGGPAVVRVDLRRLALRATAPEPVADVLVAEVPAAPAVIVPPPSPDGDGRSTLGERAAALLAVLERVAEAGETLPGSDELAYRMGYPLGITDTLGAQLAQLANRGLIERRHRGRMREILLIGRGVLLSNTKPPIQVAA